MLDEKFTLNTVYLLYYLNNNNADRYFRLRYITNFVNCNNHFQQTRIMSPLKSSCHYRYCGRTAQSVVLLFVAVKLCIISCYKSVIPGTRCVICCYEVIYYFWSQWRYYRQMLLVLKNGLHQRCPFSQYFFFVCFRV